VGDDRLYGRFAGLGELLELYAEADGRTGAFLRLSGLGCLPNCASCCDTPSVNIECTVFEALPLALRLWEDGRAESALQRALDAGDRGRCAFYEPAGMLSREGGCLEYSHRPLICRLFGFSSSRGKDGQPRLSLCRAINTRDAAKALAARGLVSSGVDLPLMSEISTRAMGLNPGLSSRRSGINLAVAGALEKVMLTASWMGLDNDRGEDMGGIEHNAASPEGLL